MTDDPEFEELLRTPLSNAEVKAFAEGRWADPYDKTWKITGTVIAPATRMAIELRVLRAKVKVRDEFLVEAELRAEGKGDSLDFDEAFKNWQAKRKEEANG